MSSRATQKVVVLMGGLSLERDVSLLSGRCCATALREKEEFEVVELDAGLDLYERLSVHNPDIVFNALHGRWGEDGCVQGILEWLRIPYTHSGVHTSALAMNKEKTKLVYKRADLPFANSIMIHKDRVVAENTIERPYVVKPVSEGSSVGVHIVDNGSNSQLSFLKEMPEIVMVEEYVPGRELTTTVIGSNENSRPLLVTDIQTEGWYNYQAKYVKGGSHHYLPADIPQKINDLCLSYALTAHRELGCRGISRSDFRWNEAKGEKGLVLLETNTQPGMTPTSLAPEQAVFDGISLSDLCVILLKDASCDR